MPDLENPLVLIDWLIDQFLRYPYKGVEDMLADAGFEDATAAAITMANTLSDVAAQLAQKSRDRHDNPNDPIPFPSAGTISDD
jgi:hypothetical protein